MAVTDVLTLDEFVDLYKILEMPETATETELRERVNKLYLEAQRNLDHHNFRKRFYYQQLYEVHLPQAHQLLLNAAHRSEYDRYLNCFNKGLPFPTDTGPTGSGPTSGDLGRSDQIATDMLPTSSAPVATAPETPTPTKFSFSPDTPVTPVSPTPIPTRPVAPASRPARPTPPEPQLAPGETAPSLAAQVAKRKAQVLMDASEVERRRDYKRRELIKRELTAAGQSWGIGAGALVFVIVAALAYFLSHGNITILGGGVAAAAVVAVVAGRYALREARRRIVVVLSKMPYDELLRRCAK